MLPILGDSNRKPSWAAQIAKLQPDFRASINTLDSRIAELFVESEHNLTEIAPSPEALLNALGLMNRHARSDSAELTAEFLFELQDSLKTEKGLRLVPAKGQVPGHTPAKPAVLASLLETTLDWFVAQSFSELHPIEQAVLVHVRFLDLQFFPAENTRLSRFAADFFLIKAELPPMILSGDNQIYKAALHQAILMNTQSLIDLIAESIVETLGRLLKTKKEEETKKR